MWHSHQLSQIPAHKEQENKELQETLRKRIKPLLLQFLWLLQQMLLRLLQ